MNVLGPKGLCSLAMEIFSLVQYLFPAFSDSLKPVWQAIVLLERATRKSPSNFHVKLLLIALYAKLGACAPCCMLFESMEIKHIQHDALG